MRRFLGAVIKSIGALILVFLFFVFLALIVLLAKIWWILVLGFLGCALAYLFIGEAWDTFKKRKA